MTQALLERPLSVKIVYDIVAGIKSFDDLEARHIADTLSWIESGVPIFRIEKPDVPNKHLVSYFILLDELEKKILLVDHKKAQLWLPAGGHVEIDEDPKETVIRECFEELKIQADFWRAAPIFLTSTITVGLTAGHTDVSLWYILKGNEIQTLNFDKEEFNDVQWFHINEIPYEKSDPHMSRFVNKLKMNFNY